MKRKESVIFVAEERDELIGFTQLFPIFSSVSMKRTCLLAPATVIGGIFGMNFESIPWLHKPYGFFAAVAIMLLIPIWMLVMFRRRGWF